MSFLSILLVASAFYFQEAHARPDSQSRSEEFGGVQANFGDGDVKDAPVVPVQSLVPITDPKVYQHQLYGFMDDVSKAIDQYMTPLVTKQDELKSMGTNGFASYINYLFGRQ